MCNGVQLFLAANTILLMRRWNHACSLLVYVISVITPGRQRALTAFRRYYLLKNKLRDRMIKQLLNSVIAKYRDLSVSRRSIICLSLRLRQIIDLLATDKSRYFAQPRPIIANYYSTIMSFYHIRSREQAKYEAVIHCSVLVWPVYNRANTGGWRRSNYG